jgi:hypothetical protein
MKKVILPCLLLLLAACTKDPLGRFKNINRVKWNGTYAVPLLNADLTIGDAVGIVDFGMLGVLPDKNIYLSFKNRHFSMKGEELLQIPDQNLNNTMALTPAEAATLNASGNITINRSLVYTLNLPTGVQFDSAWLKSGNLELVFKTNCAHTGSAKIFIGDWNVSGSPLSKNFSWITPGTNTLYENHAATLSDRVSFSSGSLGYNQIRVNAEITLSKGGTASSADRFQLDLNSTALKYRKLNGYFGQQPLLSVNDSLDLQLFSSGIIKGLINFRDARIKLKFGNSIGAETGYQISSLNFITSVGMSQSISGYTPFGKVSSAVNASIPKTTYDSVYITKAGGSNVADLAIDEPWYLQYAMSLAANPTGPSANRNFIWDESAIDVQVSLELPFFLTTKNLVIEDTSNIDLNIGKEADYVEWLNIKMFIENGMPIGAGVQAYFMDSFNNVLDSLIEPFRYIVKQATVDANGDVVAPSSEVLDLFFFKNRIYNILKAKKIRYRAWIPTSTYAGTQVPVRILNNQKLKLKLGLEAKLRVDEKI